MRPDSAVAELKLGPVREKESRFEMPMVDLQKAADAGMTVRATLNDGTVLEGTIDWHSLYFIKLKVANNASVVIFNHAVHNLQVLKPPGRVAATRR
jgi:sRNA-binding regulator protein Hfq